MFIAVIIDCAFSKRVKEELFVLTFFMDEQNNFFTLVFI